MTMAASSTVSVNSAGTPAQIALYAPDNRMLSALACIEGLENVSWIDSREMDPAKLLARLPGLQLVLLDYTGSNASYSQALAVAVSMLPSPPPMLGVGAIAEGPQQSAQLLAAIRAGVRDFIDLAAPLNDVQDILRRVRREFRANPNLGGPIVSERLPDGDLILLIGVRPGMGTSTLAAHLTTRLAAIRRKENPQDHSLLLLDFGLPAGDGALYLGVEGGFHMEDALRSISRIDATFATSALPRHESGTSVLSRTSSVFPAEETSTLVQRLRCLYQIVVCDLGGVDIGSIPTSLLLSARETWLVTDQSIGALLSLDRCLQSLEQRGARDERLQLVLNRHDEGFGLTPEQISNRFSLPMLAVLPERSRQIRSAASIGRLLHEQNPSDPYLSALGGLLGRLSPTEAGASASPLARLANYMSPLKWKKN